MEYGINRNGSGYYDPTAYTALKNILKSEEKSMKLYKGDIVEVEMMNGCTREAIIISVHDKYSTILMLTENENLPYSVNCKGLKFTDPGMIQYAFNDKFKNFIRSMKEDEIDDLFQAVIDGLGYEAHMKEVVNEVTPEFIPPVADNTPFNDAIMEELTKAKAERDVFKKLYEDLIHKVIGK